MFNGTLSGKRMMRNVFRQCRKSQELRDEILTQGHWTCLGPGSEEKVVWRVLLTLKKESGIATANKMVQRFKESGHLVFDKYQCLESWNLEAEER